MPTSLVNITLIHLLIAFLPVIPVVWILFHWELRWQQAVYALARMLAQLLLIGYVLVFIFAADDALLIGGLLGLMVMIASWISTGSIAGHRRQLFPSVLLALCSSCGLILLLVTQATLDTQPWYNPRVILPLAGMIIANAMNTVSIAAERLMAELESNQEYVVARNKSFQAALIPVVNSLFAVGLVALPGMMTGQILSGVSPMIAARYQIIVMCMLFAASGLAAAAFLVLARPYFEAQRSIAQTAE